jgi:hypothetical protein
MSLWTRCIRRDDWSEIIMPRPKGSWEEKAKALMGTVTDEEGAWLCGVSRRSFCRARRKMNVPVYKKAAEDPAFISRLMLDWGRPEDEEDKYHEKDC